MKLYFKNDRDRDFLAAYHKVLHDLGDKAPYVSREELIERTISGGAPRFYVTYELARRNICSILQGKPYPCNNRLKQEMYQELTRRTLECMERCKNRKGFNEALMTVLSEHSAPRFYMTIKSARNLLSQLQRKQRNLQRSHH